MNDILQLSGNNAKTFLENNKINFVIKHDLFLKTLNKTKYNLNNLNNLKYRIYGISRDCIRDRCKCEYYNEVVKENCKNTEHCKIILVNDELYVNNSLTKDVETKLLKLKNNNTITADTKTGGKKNKYNDITVKQLRQLVKEKGKSIKKRDGTGYNTKQQLISKLNR